MISRKGMKVKLDKELSRVIRSHGSCVRCGNEEYSKLQCAHIISRSNLAVRWDLSNVLCLCAGCHFWAHKNPTLFTEFVIFHLGEKTLDALHNNSLKIKKWTSDELLELLEQLKKL